MAGYGDKPFGLREVKVTDVGGANAVALPRSMILHFVELINHERFEAEGAIVAASSFTAGVEWELEAGGISLEAWAKMTGRTASASGTTPNRTLTLTAANDSEFPYFAIYGRSLGDTTDDVRCRLFKCKLASIEGTFRLGEFWVTSCAGIAVKTSSGFYDFVERETGAAL